MGGHWGASSSASDRSTVRASTVADALEEWTYSTSPSDRDAVARRLSEAFPDSTVRPGDGSTAHDVVVGDVRVLIAHGLDAAFRRDFHTLADRFDDLIVYSTTPHTATPNEWREFKHRHRGRHAGARVRFVHRRDPATGEGAGAARALAALAVPAVGIVALLATSLGLFGTGGAVAAGLEDRAHELGAVAVPAVAATVTYLLTRRGVCASVLRRIPHT